MAKKKEIVITWKVGDVWSSADKTRWRKTKDWKDHRNNLIKEKKVCELCGYEKRLTVHHKVQSNLAEDYVNLKNNRFKVLCSGCHRYLHRVWASYVRKKDPIKPDKRLEKILNDFFEES